MKRADLSAFENVSQGLSDSEAFPKSLRKKDSAVPQSPDDLHPAEQLSGPALRVLPGLLDQIDDLDAAYADDGPTEPGELIPVHPVGPAEAVDYVR